MAVTVSALAGPLLALGRIVWPTVKQLHAEKTAGSTPVRETSPLIEQALRQSLQHIVRESAQSWWRDLLARAAQQYVSPDFLLLPAVQDWLKEDETQKAFIILGTYRLLNPSSVDDPASTAILSRNYSRHTGDAEELARGPIEAVLAVLAVGFLGTLSSDARKIIAITQAITQAEGDKTRQEMRGQFDILAERTHAGRRQVDETHTGAAKIELTRILLTRGIPSSEGTTRISNLLKDVTKGALGGASDSIRDEISYWAARFWAAHQNTVADAENYLKAPSPQRTVAELAILRAAIAKTNGDSSHAIQILLDTDDSDARSVAFSFICDARGEKTGIEWFRTLGREDLALFSSRGWCNLAIMLAQNGDFASAQQVLDRAQPLNETWPDLYFVGGLITAASLLPAEWRHFALGHVPFLTYLKTASGTDADRRRQLARQRFRGAISAFESLGEATRVESADLWILWLQLTSASPEEAAEARDDIRRRMTNPSEAKRFIMFTHTFNIDFDSAALRNYLAQRRHLNLLSDDDWIADYLLNANPTNPSVHLQYLETHETELRRVLTDEQFTRALVEVLARNGQSTRARAELNRRSGSLPDEDFRRLSALLDLEEGQDPRVVLEAQYRRSDSLIDLRNLVEFLQSQRDWSSLTPFLSELFKRDENVDTAERLLKCMQRDPSFSSRDMLSFLDEHNELVQINKEIKAIRAWTLFALGFISEAKATNDTLLQDNPDDDAVALDINLAIQEGAWERFGEIIEREWHSLPQRSAQILMQLASVAAENPALVDRAQDLLRQATQKEPENVEILLSAYVLSIQIGRDESAWLQGAIERSDEKGPVKRVEFRQLVEELLPTYNERSRLIDDQVREGTLPLAAMARMTGSSLAHLLVAAPNRNFQQNDARRKGIVPIRSGARLDHEIQDSWKLALDITSILQLARIDLLSSVVGIFAETHIAPDTLLILLEERRRARYHQPRLVERAKAILSFRDGGQIEIAPAAEPPDWLSKEVGNDLAELLENARLTGGKVVLVEPVYKLSTYLESEADLKHYRAFATSVGAVLEHLSSAGFLPKGPSVPTGSIVEVRVEPTLDPRHPLYLDEPALADLQGNGTLKILANINLNLRVHRAAFEHQDQLVTYELGSERQIHVLERARSVLREGIRKGKVKFLPRPKHSEKVREKEWRATASTFADFTSGRGDFDAMSVDDRAFNSSHAARDSSGKLLQIVCSYDLLKFVFVHEKRTLVELYAALNEMRKAGLAFVPISEEELWFYVHSIPGDFFFETSQLTILRQYHARLQSLDFLRLPSEERFLNLARASSFRVIRRLWSSPDVGTDKAEATSDWILTWLGHSPHTWKHDFPEPDEVRKIVRGALAPWTVPIFDLRGDARKRYREWLEGKVFSTLLPANLDTFKEIVDETASRILSMVEDEEHEAT